MAIACAIAAANDSRCDIFARCARIGKPRLTLRLRRTTAPEPTTQVRREVCRERPTEGAARGAIDGWAARVVAGVDVAVAEAGAGFADAVAGALAATAGDAVAADAVAAGSAGGAVGVGGVDAVAGGAAALAAGAAFFAADFSVALEGGSARAGATFVVEIAGAAEAELAFSAPGAFAIAGAAGFLGAERRSDAATFLSGSVAALADAAARDVAAASVEAASADALRARGARRAEVALRADALSVAVAAEGSGTRLSAARRPTADRELAAAGAAVAVGIACGAQGPEARAATETLQAVATTGLDRVGDARPRGVAAFTGRVTRLGAADAVDAGEIAAVARAVARLTR